MKRIALVTFVVLSLLCAGGAAISMGTRAKMSPPKWMSLGTNQWRTHASGKEPEIVFLRISNDEYNNKFLKDKKGYLDPLLTQPSQSITSCDTKSNSADNSNDWTIIVSHTPNSTVTYVAFQQITKEHY